MLPSFDTVSSYRIYVHCCFFTRTFTNVSSSKQPKTVSYTSPKLLLLSRKNHRKNVHIYLDSHLNSKMKTQLILSSHHLNLISLVQTFLPPSEKITLNIQLLLLYRWLPNSHINLIWIILELRPLQAFCQMSHLLLLAISSKTTIPRAKAKKKIPTSELENSIIILSNNESTYYNCKYLCND